MYSTGGVASRTRSQIGLLRSITERARGFPGKNIKPLNDDSSSEDDSLRCLGESSGNTSSSNGLKAKRTGSAKYKNIMDEPEPRRRKKNQLARNTKAIRKKKSGNREKGIERITEAEFRSNSKRHRSNEAETARKRKCDSRSRNVDKDTILEPISEAEFRSKHHGSRVKYSAEEGFAQGSRGKGHYSYNDDDFEFLGEQIAHIIDVSDSLEEDSFQFLGESSGLKNIQRNKNKKQSRLEVELEMITEDEFRSGQKRRSENKNADENKELTSSSSGEAKTESLQADEIRSHGSGCEEVNHGVESQSQSESGPAETSTEAEMLSCGSSDGETSYGDGGASDTELSSESEPDDSNDEDFKIENSDSEGIDLSSSSAGEDDEEDSGSEKVSGKKSDDHCANNCDEIHSAKRHSDGDHEEETNNHHSSTRQESSSNKSQTSLDKDLVERGKRKQEHLLNPPVDSTEIFKQKVNSGEDDDCNGNAVAVQVDEPETKRSRVYPRTTRGFLENLLDRALSYEAEFGDEQAKGGCEQEDTLVLKFRFEDEDEKPVEKSEYEIMIENLFAEMDFCLNYGNVDFTEYREVAKDNANPPEAETSQNDPCSKGKHCLVEDDEEGLFCKYCHHVELEAKHLMPPWAEREYRGGNRRRPSSPEKPLVVNGFDDEPGTSFRGSSYLSKGTVWDVKPGLRQALYEHQQEGLEFLWKNLAGTTNLAELNQTVHSSNIGGCIISHAPGTGKTRLTMVFIESYMKLFPDCRPLIIAPAGMLLTWEEEFKKWDIEFPFHNLNNLDFSGEESNNTSIPVGKSGDNYVSRIKKVCSWIKRRSILGISYSLFGNITVDNGKKKRPSDDELLKRLKTVLLEKPSLVFLDEGHIPRNKKSIIWNAILKLKTNKRIILSGTPFQNNFDELFNILRIVRPTTAGVLATESIFAEMMTSRGKQLKSKNEEREESFAIEMLKTAMAPFVHVHKGTILQQSLPGLRDCALLLNPLPLQKSLIIEQSNVPGNSFKYDHMVALISVHPYLINHCSTIEKGEVAKDVAKLDQLELDPSEGVKTRFLMHLVHRSICKNEKVLVFSQYIEPLKLIKAHLKKTFSWAGEKHVLVMQGKMDQKKRQELINAFNDPCSEAKVLLASTKCCSEGINLVGASRVVLLDVVWNPSVERQAISRAYRLGQKKVVYTYHLMTSGTTEGEKFTRQVEKERLSELVFSSSSNEQCKDKNLGLGMKDELLEDMLADEKLKSMFDKIHYQPKEKDLIETFQLAS